MTDSIHNRTSSAATTRRWQRDSYRFRRSCCPCRWSSSSRCRRGNTSSWSASAPCRHAWTESSGRRSVGLNTSLCFWNGSNSASCDLKKIHRPSTRTKTRRRTSLTNASGSCWNSKSCYSNDLNCSNGLNCWSWICDSTTSRRRGSQNSHRRSGRLSFEPRLPRPTPGTERRKPVPPRAVSSS